MAQMNKWQVEQDPLVLRRIGKTAEEILELGEEICKLGKTCMRIVLQGIDGEDPKSEILNKDALQNEIADVFAQLDVNCGILDLDLDFIQERRRQKFNQMVNWEQLYKPSQIIGFDPANGPDTTGYHELKSMWNGEDLPPVGTHCEAASGEEWFRVRINGYSKSHVFLLINYENEAAGDIERIGIDELQFRPINARG